MVAGNGPIPSSESSLYVCDSATTVDLHVDRPEIRLSASAIRNRTHRALAATEPP